MLFQFLYALRQVLVNRHLADIQRSSNLPILHLPDKTQPHHLQCLWCKLALHKAKHLVNMSYFNIDGDDGGLCFEQ